MLAMNNIQRTELSNSACKNWRRGEVMRVFAVQPIDLGMIFPISCFDTQQRGGGNIEGDK